MTRTKLVIIIFLTIILTTAVVQAGENDDLQWRMELIEASQNINAGKKSVSPDFHRLGTVFTTFGTANLNTGLRLAPYLNWDVDSSLHFMGELFYLNQEDDFAGFVSLMLLENNLYAGVGGEVTGSARYHAFFGWEATENIFLELRAINTEGDIMSSRIYPLGGFQFQF